MVEKLTLQFLGLKIYRTPHLRGVYRAEMIARYAQLNWTSTLFHYYQDDFISNKPFRYREIIGVTPAQGANASS